jgi:threonine/homoserine/homoserine lactone efflux protein
MSSLLIAFIVFASVALFTPGPNNIMLLASGLNFGVRRTLPHVAGVSIGFAILVAAMGLGLGAVFTSYPVLQTVLKYAGAAYLIYLAFAIATSGPAQPDATAHRQPLSFLGAALFQWVNVKGWVIAIGTISAYGALADYPWNVLLQALVLLTIGTLSSLTWVICGSALQSLVKSPLALRVFNVTMALLLLASLYPVLRDP